MGDNAPMDYQSLVDENFEFSEALFPLDENINVNISMPMKRALVKTAAKMGFSVSDLVRNALSTYLPERWPEFKAYYVRAKADEARKLGITIEKDGSR